MALLSIKDRFERMERRLFLEESRYLSDESLSHWSVAFLVYTLQTKAIELIHLVYIFPTANSIELPWSTGQESCWRT